MKQLCGVRRHCANPSNARAWMHSRSRPRKTWCAPSCGLRSSGNNAANRTQRLQSLAFQRQETLTPFSKDIHVIYLAHTFIDVDLCAVPGAALCSDATAAAQFCSALRQPGTRARWRGKRARDATTCPGSDLPGRDYDPALLTGASTGDG